MVKTERKATLLMLLCSLAYFSSYITRNNYSAILVELIQDLNTTKQIASIGVTGSFITYGLGMLLSGWLGDKFPARWMVAIGLLGSCVINLCAGTFRSIYLITGLWCFNGLFQSMIYPPLMRLMGDNLSTHQLVSGITWVNIACNIATVLIYLISPVLITWSGWRMVFLVSAGVGALTTVVFMTGTKDTKSQQTKSDSAEQKAPIGKLILKAGLIPLFVSIVLMGALRDGVQTWTPTYISEVMRMDSSKAILISVSLPILSILSIAAAKVLFSKIRNEMRTAFLVYAIGSVTSTLLIFTFSSLPFIGVAMLAITNASMHGVNLVLISLVPAKFKKYGKISTFTGFINAFVYLGSAISTYGIAVISDKLGWSATIICWAVMAVTGTLICLARIKKWTRFINE